MAVSLPPLPTELLLKVIESERIPVDRKRLFSTMRVTCAELSSNLVHFFGSEYFRTIRVEISQSTFLQLRSISKGPLRVHFQDVVIGITTLFEQNFFETTSDETDASQCSWYSEGTFADMDVRYCECSFVESIVEFIADGSFSRMLCAALSGFSNLKTFTIAPPSAPDEFVKGKIIEINIRWSIACKVLLNAVLIGNFALEELSIPQGCEHPSMPLSALEMITAHWPQWPSPLLKLHLNLAYDPTDGTTRHVVCLCNELIRILVSSTMGVTLLSTLLRKLTTLMDLRLALRESPHYYFKALAKALPTTMGLHRLELSDISTRYRYIAMVLRTCKETLRSLTLSHVTFGEPENFDKMVMLCHYQLKLRESFFRGINAENKGLHFGHFNKRRPQTVEGLTTTPYFPDSSFLVTATGYRPIRV
jgi:hypothetical protein